MSISPDEVASPLAQAPPDRPTRDLESVAQEFVALVLRDGGIDLNEQRVVRWVVEQFAMQAQAPGGFNGRPAEDASQPPPSPQAMNANTSDFGDGQGEPTGEEY